MAKKLKKKSAFRITHYKLAFLALVVFCLLTGLGVWQLSRAHQKRDLWNMYTARTANPPFAAKALGDVKDWRFYRVVLTGQFDNEHTLLLDNKTFHGKVGYEVYTPFHSKEMAQPMLVDRGFIPMGADRAELPNVPAIKGKVTVTGMLNTLPVYRHTAKLTDGATITWPLRVEYITFSELTKLLNQSFFPYALTLSPEDPRAFPMEWQIIGTSPEKHMGYAIQWFALALTLLILFVALNRS